MTIDGTDTERVLKELLQKNIKFNIKNKTFKKGRLILFKQNNYHLELTIKNNNDELKTAAYGSVKDLTSRFVASYKTTQCRDLIGCDLNTPEGSAKFKEEKIMENVCAGCVKKAVEILEDLTA